MQRMVVTGLLLVGLVAVPVRAAGPFIVNDAGEPLTWNLPIVFNPDRGSLGLLDNTTAVNAVTADFGVWEAVPTSTASYTNGGALPMDVTAENIFTVLGVCGDGLSPIIFDVDGSITDTVFGAGASNSVLGFAGPDCGTQVPPVITEGVAVLNGKFVDGIDTFDNPEITPAEFDAVFIHEFGHYTNLDHTQVGLAEAFDGDPLNDEAGIATMFPIAVNPTAASTLHLDDRVSVSTLYPAPGFGTGFGRISGQILRGDGVTPFTGAHVVARKFDDPLATAVSFVSGALLLDGAYELPGLPAGSYTVEVEAVDPGFTDGSSVGPIDPPARLPGPPEFWNGANEAGTDPPDDPADFSLVNVSTGATTGNIDVLLNTPLPAGNDSCGTPTIIGALPFTDLLDTSGATSEPSDPIHSCGSGPSDSGNVWYEFVAPADGVLQVDTFGSDYDTVLAVYTGSCGAATEIACNDDAVILQSAVDLAVLSGQQLLIEVAHYGGTGGGSLVLNVSLNTATPPDNDSCAAPTRIGALPFTDLVDTLGATSDASDPVHSCGFGPLDSSTVWYEFVAPAGGVLQVDTFGSDYDTVLAVYTGSCGAATEIACNDDAIDLLLQSQVDVPVATGQQILIEVAAYGLSGGGSLVLNAALLDPPEPVSCPPPGPAAGAMELLTNGDFEAGMLTGWTVTASSVSSPEGGFVSESAALAPISGNPTAGPACGNFYALSDQAGPGTRTLAQTFAVPAGATNVTLAFDLFVDDWAFSGGIVDPIGLDHTGPSNQHARVDILDGAAGPLETGAGVLGSFYIGVDSGDVPHGYTRYGFDITSVVGAGGMFTIRFAETDNLFFLNVGVDNVSITAVDVCTADSECEDGDACTIDTCDGGTCTNTTIMGCIPCAGNTECADADTCTTDTCEDGVCSNVVVADLPSVQCKLGAAKTPPLCGEEEVPRKLERFVGKKFTKAGKLLTKAEKKPQKQDRFRNKALKQVSKVDTKASKFASKDKISSECRATLSGLVAELTPLITALEF